MSNSWSKLGNIFKSRHQCSLTRCAICSLSELLMGKSASSPPPTTPPAPANDYFCNQPIKDILFEIYHASNRYDVRNLVLDALLIFFERVYDEQRTQILESNNYAAIMGVVNEIRMKLIRDHQVWRQRQWYGLFVEKLVTNMEDKCPAHVLLNLFAEDMFDLANEQIVLIRQLYPRVMRNLNAGYLNHPDCNLPAKEIFGCLLMRLADLAFEDSDMEIQRSARETFAKFEESDA